jgi:hypothetical protein
MSLRLLRRLRETPHQVSDAILLGMRSLWHALSARHRAAGGAA